MLSNVLHHEAAGAVGVLDHAGREAGLPDGGGLLIAGHTANGHRGAQQFGLDHAELGGGFQHLWHHRLGYAKEAQQVWVPALLDDIE